MGTLTLSLPLRDRLTEVDLSVPLQPSPVFQDRAIGPWSSSPGAASMPRHVTQCSSCGLWSRAHESQAALSAQERSIAAAVRRAAWDQGPVALCRGSAYAADAWIDPTRVTAGAGRVSRNGPHAVDGTSEKSDQLPRGASWASTARVHYGAWGGVHPRLDGTLPEVQAVAGAVKEGDT
jgi:hypothetical protein